MPRDTTANILSNDTSGRRVILVTGAPRSGTTWVGNVLQHCPRTMLLTEPFNPDLSRRPARVCDHRFREWYTYITDENAAMFETPLREMLALKHKTFSHLREAKSMRDVIDVAARGARYRLSRFTTTTSIIKDPIALLSSQWLARRFGAAVVILIRHPAAVVSSFKRLDLRVDTSSFLRQPLLLRDLLGPMEAELRELLSQPHDLVDHAAMQWKALHAAVRVFQERHPEWLFIRHEDLSRDAMGGFERICNHVGLPFTSAVRRAVIESNDATLPSELNADQAFTTRRNAAWNLENWKTRLTPQEIERVRNRVENVSRHFYDDAAWSRA